MTEHTYDMSVIVFDTRILPLLARNEAWWLWREDAQKLLLTNKMGATLMGASGISMALARSYSASHRFASQILRISTSLEERNEPRLERLNVQNKFVSSSQVFQAMRLVFADGSKAILLKSALGAADNTACVEFIENAPFPMWGFTKEGEPIAASDKGLTLAKSSLKLLLGSAAKQTLVQLDEYATSKIMLTSGELSLIIPPDYEMILALLVEGKNALVIDTSPQSKKPRLVVPLTPPEVFEPIEQVFIDEYNDDDMALSFLSQKESFDEIEEADFELEEPLEKVDTVSQTIFLTNDSETGLNSNPPRFDRERKVRFVWQTDSSRRFIAVSHEFEEIVGAKNAQILNSTWEELVERYDLTPNEALSQAFKGRDTWSGYSVDWPIEGQTAKAVIDFAALPVFDRVRGFTGFRGFGVIKDYVVATPQKALPSLKPLEAKAFHEIGVALGTKTPPAPKLSKAQLADTSLLDTLPMGVVIYHGNRVHYANSHLLNWSGYASCEELENLGGMGRLFAGTQLELGGEALSITTKDSRLLPVTARLVTTKWQGESALAMILSEKEIVKPKPSLEAEALAESTLILENACDGFVLLDPDLNISHLNKGALKLFGQEEDALIGTALPSHFTLLDKDAMTAFIQKAGEDYKETSLEVLLNAVFYDLKLVQLPRQEGICYAAILRDLTKWIEAKEELVAAKLKAEEASSQKSSFLARVSHEIRTPLNAMLGFTEVMREEHFGPIGNERYSDYLQDIQSSGQHVLSLVNDLLDVAKIESGQLSINIQPLTLNAHINETLLLLQEEARRARVVIRVSLTPDLPDVLFDKRNLTQILLNLVGNALKFTPAGGQIIISTSLDEEEKVLLRVRDTGIGMNEEELKEALLPFKSKDKTGTGLGLPLTKALVEANLGIFTLTSRPSEGTMAQVLLKTQKA